MFRVGNIRSDMPEKNSFPAITNLPVHVVATDWNWSHAEPDKLATYEKLTAAINRAKEAGDIQTLREIAEDPAGFILRQGWTGLDFSDGVELAGLRRLHETLQLEIIAVIESLEQLKESAEYELCGIAEQRPGVLDELAAERTRLLERESAELQKQAEKLADEIKELKGAAAERIG